MVDAGFLEGGGVLLYRVREILEPAPTLIKPTTIFDHIREKLPTLPVQSICFD